MLPTPGLVGQSFEYEVGDYHLRITFVEPTRVHWFYLAAPNGLAGKDATETIEMTWIRKDIVLVCWKEADGTQVVDVLDVGKMVIYANFVTADGTRSSSQANVSRAVV